jgi:hypothetical protein
MRKELHLSTPDFGVLTFWVTLEYIPFLWFRSTGSVLVYTD